MNDYQKSLYNNLINLTKNNEAFYSKDFILDDHIYRIFSYRLASYSDFLLPDALECRGIMFEMHHFDDIPFRLVSLPMEKFFNVNENPFTIDIDFNNIDYVTEKMDGSLMSTYIHNGELRLKSKGSIESSQAYDAMKFLNLPENIQFKKILEYFADIHYTVNLEYTAPSNRVVIGYNKPALTILNVRNNLSGEYLERHRVLSLSSIVDMSVCSDNLVKCKIVEDKDKIDFVKNVSKLTDIEGYVIKMNNGQHIKIKTDWYIALHHAKDSITNPRRLYECILEETIDDLKSMFAEDEYSLNIILEMEKNVSKIYNHLVKVTEDFYNNNKHLERKDFAIKAREELDSKEFTIVMLLYSNKSFSYKELMKKWYKDYGFNDISKEILTSE